MDVLNSLIKAVRSPLGFWVYVIGVVGLVNMAISGSLRDSTWWLPTLSLLVIASGAAITWLQIARPGVLQNWERRNAEGFGRDLADALIAHFGNLPPDKRQLAWQETIRVVGRARDDEDEAVALFRTVVAEHLRDAAGRSELGSRATTAIVARAPVGVIQTEQIDARP